MRARTSFRSITILLVAFATAHCSGAADDDVAGTVDAPEVGTAATTVLVGSTSTTSATEKKADGGTKQDFLIVTMKDVIVSAY